MSSAEARRLARQRRILANPEDRMNRITQDKKFERVDLPADLLPSQPEVEQEAAKRNEILNTGADENSPLEAEVFSNPDPIVSDVPPASPFVEESRTRDISEVRAKQEGHTSFSRKWLSFFIWFVLGVSVRLLLSKPELSWTIADNAFSAFVVAYLVKYFGFVARNDEDVSSGREQGGLVFLALKMCGMKPAWIDLLKRSSETIVDVSETFSVYFVAFLVTHFVVDQN